MNRPEATDKVLLAAIEALTVNVGRRIEEKGRGAFVSSHEALGVVTEEFHELVEAVRQNDPIETAEELMDIAVACIMAVASMMVKEEELANVPVEPSK